MRGGAWGKEFEVLWKNFAPPKAAATAWTALWNRLPTRTNLRKRKVLDSGTNRNVQFVAEVEKSASPISSWNAMS